MKTEAIKNRGINLTYAEQRNFPFLNFYNKITAEENRYGTITMALLIMVAWGGLTVGWGALTSEWQLAAVVFPTVIGLAFTLAVAPMKLIVNTVLFALAVDCVIIVMNLLG